jgi:hypothetical protein
VISLPSGWSFSIAILYALTGGNSFTDDTAITANTVTVAFGFN